MSPKACFILAGGLAALHLAFCPLAAVAAERVIAYQVPAETEGNQAFGGTLGMDFAVANPILVTQLGVFDDLSDGLKLPITAKLWDRSNPEAPEALVTVEFTPEDPGVLIGGSRFKPLPAPLRLEIGFLGTVSAEGYGAEERLRNAGAVPRTWTINDGSGSLVFVGTSRYGTVNGEYPDVADGGPADRYAAGTFEFETTPPVKPGPPGSLTLEPSDGRIRLAWAVVTAPLPAAKYEVWRASSPTAEFTKLAETTTPEYTDAGLSNDSLYCYRVLGIGAGGQVGQESARVCGAAYVLPEGQRVAYLVQAGTAGTQNFGGVIGMDFEIANPILITHLGVFDDGSDGLARALTARLWDRSVPDAPVEVASLEFTPEAPGVLIRGSRFKPLPSPIRLEVGFRGTISAENYGAEERLVNPGGNPAVARPWEIEGGQGSIRFMGTGRYALNPGEFPGTPDAGAPDRYGAGTFQYQTTALVNPGVPVVTAGLGDQSAVLSWSAVQEPAPAARYRVLRREGEVEPIQVAELAEPGFTDAGLTRGAQYCYSVVSVTAAGQAGAGSPEVCLTAEAREPGVAYVVAEGTVGNQSFGGALGMDFDVMRSVRITRLGVFDDSSDGLFLTIQARLYDRNTRQVLAELTFSPEDPGELIGGSRFKNLPQPLLLPSGFQGTMAASGYGGDERNGNGVAGRSLFSAGGSLAFVGRGAYNVNASDYPGTVDAGPANRYAAGTFYFEPAAEAPVLAVSRAGSKVALTWAGGGSLESAPAAVGPWTAVPGAASGMQVDPVGAAAFYRVRQ